MPATIQRGKTTKEKGTHSQTLLLSSILNVLYHHTGHLLLDGEITCVMERLASLQASDSFLGTTSIIIPSSDEHLWCHNLQ